MFPAPSYTQTLDCVLLVSRPFVTPIRSMSLVRDKLSNTEPTTSSSQRTVPMPNS